MSLDYAVTHARETLRRFGEDSWTLRLRHMLRYRLLVKVIQHELASYKRMNDVNAKAEANLSEILNLDDLFQVPGAELVMQVGPFENRSWDFRNPNWDFRNPNVALRLRTRMHHDRWAKTELRSHTLRVQPLHGIHLAVQKLRLTHRSTRVSRWERERQERQAQLLQEQEPQELVTDDTPEDSGPDAGYDDALYSLLMTMVGPAE